MYPEFFRRTIRRHRPVEATIPKPSPVEATIPRPSPIVPIKNRNTGVVPPRWSGAWRPERVMRTRSTGELNDSTSADPESYAPATATTSAWGDLWNGLLRVVTPAAQAIAQSKAQGAVLQQQQRTMAQTWNPGLTAPALQAQAWQTAYQSGTGSAPLGMTTGTMLLAAAAVVGLVLITRK